MALTRIKTDQILDGTITGNDIDTSTSASFDALTLSGDLNVDSGTLFVDSANGRVGVGTTNPDNGDLSTHDPIIHVKGPENVGDYRLVARFESGDDKDNTGASILINHENDRGLLVEAGRSVGDSAIANFNIVNNVGDATKAITIEEGGNISFYEDTGTTPKFFWDASAERLGIGTSSPDYQLDIFGGSSSVGLRGVTGSAETEYAKIVARNGFSSDGTEQCKIGFRSASNFNTAHITFHTTNTFDGMTERARIDSSGNLLVGTTTSPSDSGAIVAGGGIYLGGTGSANYLDDYEEGTWTPTYELVSTPTYTAQQGRYIKTGNIVHLYGRINVSSLNNSDGSAIAIGSYPFSPRVDFSGHPAIASTISTDDSDLLIYPLSSGKEFFGWKITSSYALPTTSDGDFIRYDKNVNSSGVFIFGFSYLTDS